MLENEVERQFKNQIHLLETLKAALDADADQAISLLIKERERCEAIVRRCESADPDEITNEVGGTMKDCIINWRQEIVDLSDMIFELRQERGDAL